MNAPYKNSKIKTHRKARLQWKLVIIALLLLFAGAVYFFFIRETTQPTTSGEIRATSPSKTLENKAAGSSSPATPPPAKDTTTGEASSPASVLSEAPSGTFVSNHKPSLGGSPAPSEEQSTCVTVPGATCYIQFVKDGVVKTLPSQVADDTGTVIWNWDVKKAGFTGGEWQITAIATLNGSKKEAIDSLKLEVGP